MKTRIDFSCAPFHHNMMPTTPSVYSGKYVVRVHQWGVYSLDSDTGEFKMLSPVGKIDASFQRPTIAITGDCWQSATKCAASPAVAKWVVLIGTPPNCAASGQPHPAEDVQVLRLDGGLRYIGGVLAPKVNRTSAPVVVDGDFAWAPEGLFPATLFTKINLNSLQVVSSSVPLPVGIAPPQTDIGGFTYAIHQVTQQAFYAEQLGGGGIVLPTYCGQDPVTRNQAAVMIWKAAQSMIANPPQSATPPPATGAVFSDVPADGAFSPFIEDLQRRGVIAGKSPCQS